MSGKVELERQGLDKLPKPADATVEDWYAGQPWHGHARWCCKHCEFDTLESADIVRDHIFTCHMLRPQYREVGAELYDAQGRPVQVMEKK